MSMQLVLMNCLKDKKYGDALSACNSLLARFPTDAMALECKTLLTEKAELAEMPTDGEEESEEGDERDEGGGDEDDDEEGSEVSRTGKKLLRPRKREPAPWGDRK